MTTLRTHGWRLALVLAGVLIALGGRLHPDAESTDPLRQELATMTAHENWVPGHALIMFGTFALVAGLWLARATGVWAEARRALTVAAVAMSLYAVETVFHLAASVDAHALAHGDAAPVAFTHVGLSVVLYPLAGGALAALGVRLVRTLSGVRRIPPLLAVVAGVMHGLSVPATLLLPDAELSPMFAIGGMGMALWAIGSGLLGAGRARVVEDGVAKVPVHV
ncbi:MULTISPECIES: hypothetical protein [unclassified Knoellia]|uniref:hypothetical protein n=1 Tax=Knoellia altitudinis TaxID=3404795 RepID=UPI00362394F4